MKKLLPLILISTFMLSGCVRIKIEHSETHYGTNIEEYEDLKRDEWTQKGQNVDFKDRHIVSFETFTITDTPSFKEYKDIPQYWVLVYGYGETESESIREDFLNYVDTGEKLIFLTRDTDGFGKSTQPDYEFQILESRSSVGAEYPHQVIIAKKPTLLVINNNGFAAKELTEIYIGASQIKNKLGIEP